MTYVVLLRGINVGGNVKVSMTELRAFLAEQGCENPRTLLQSGNAVLAADEKEDPAALERRLEDAAPERLGGIRPDFLVRTAPEWARLIAANPFPREAQDDPSRLLVTMLKSEPDPAAVDALRAALSGPETLCVDGRQLYAAYPHGIGRSKLTHALIESKLRTRATSRNWNTVLKLDALARG